MSDKTVKEKSVKAESSFKRKLKYGSVAMTFTIVVIALIFLLNVVSTAFHLKNPMMIDMTKKQIYEISDASRELLKDITAPVEIVFFMDIDMFEKTVPGGGMIVNCIKSYANEFDNITYSYVDIIKNPAAKNRFTASNISSPSTQSVGIISGTTPRMLRNDAFFTIAESTGQAMGFAGERILTSTILQVTNDDAPLVYFTTGHGETPSKELYDLLILEGCKVDVIDLSTQEIDPETKLIIISNPIKDFLGADPNDPSKRSEIDKVASFLNNFGNVMFFTSPQVDYALPELDGFLREYNIEFQHGMQIIDQVQALDTYGLSLNASYFVSEGAGDELHASIRKLPSASRTVVPRVKPVKILELANDVRVSPVLKSPNTAQIVNLTDGNTSMQGAFDLLLLASKTQYVNNEPKSSFLLACGSYDFLGNLNNSQYSNDDIILNALRIMTSRKVATDIDWKEFDSSALSMTLEQQGFWTMICLFVAPSVSSLAGIIVWLKRRHS